MKSGESLGRDPFGKDEDEDEEKSDDYFEMEIPQLADESKVIRMENEIVRRQVDTYSPGNVAGLGNYFFTAWGPSSVILHG
jgi:hypothetical protein